MNITKDSSLGKLAGMECEGPTPKITIIDIINKCPYNMYYGNKRYGSAKWMDSELRKQFSAFTKDMGMSWIQYITHSDLI